MTWFAVFWIRFSSFADREHALEGLHLAFLKVGGLPPFRLGIVNSMAEKAAKSANNWEPHSDGQLQTGFRELPMGGGLCTTEGADLGCRQTSQRYPRTLATHLRPLTPSLSVNNAVCTLYLTQKRLLGFTLLSPYLVTFSVRLGLEQNTCANT